MHHTHDITISEYCRVHLWLRKNFPKPTKCEGTNCKGISKRYEWALRKGYKYECKRENFIHLCKSCHSKQDFTEEGKKRISIAMGIRWGGSHQVETSCRECNKKFFDRRGNKRVFCSLSCKGKWTYRNITGKKIKAWNDSRKPLPYQPIIEKSV